MESRNDSRDCAPACADSAGLTVGARGFTLIESPVVSARKRAAFTLVELLVVVGIISVLIALLMPALSKVRKHAQEIHCAANLRSIGQALTMYTQQYHYYPGCMSAQILNGAGAIWPTRLRVFTGSQAVFNCPAQDEQFYWKEGVPVWPETYPAQEIHSAWYAYNVGEPLIGFIGSYFTYGYNMAGLDDSPAPLLTSGDPFLRGLGAYVSVDDGWRQRGRSFLTEKAASLVIRPSEMIAIADSTPDGVYDFVIKGTRNESGSEWPGDIHRGGANVLFCDGHVTWYVQSDLVGPAQNDVTKRCMWHNDNLP